MNTRQPPLPPRLPFVDYAISYFSGHISRATSSDDRLVISLDEFFRTNSLTWIELVALQHDLSPLTETAKNLKVFMERRAKYLSPLGKEVQNVLEWADDLIRLVAQFGRALLSTPSAIHFLIPSVCPSGSIIFRNFARYPKPLKLAGISQLSWDDRLCCITCTQTRVLCVACDLNKFAIGLSNGMVQVYHGKTFQKVFSLAHGAQVRCLEFSRVKGLPSGFCEPPEALMAGTRDNKMIFWDARAPFGHIQSPIHAAFSAGLGLLGVVYRMRPITFWEIESCNFAGQYHKTGAIYHEPYVHAFLFNPVSEICLAAVAFHDGDIAVFDPCGNGEVVIKLFDFETLRLLYKINSHEENIHSIAFSADGIRFYDIRADHCNIWEPSVLIRRINSGDDSSIDQSDKIRDKPQFTTARPTDEGQEITTFATHPNGEFIFCGFEIGSVKAYYTYSGKHIQNVIEHPSGIAILLLRWNETATLLSSVDRTGCILIHRIFQNYSVTQPFLVQNKIFECVSPSPVQQLLD
ncbi:WD40 repeat-like protein [Massarina eburnea CBS 473.64]|uniref:WD40 repeat-like protein n=1 Tax=Massarina eburnea CBS 473.64 TaxID=1395130 RepID=A0A6A6RYS2_9PLEO|nr:WD40 repeat-like protein [Massarina eburnea CBS 473.64]